MKDSEIASYYSALLREHGPTHRAGDHGSEANLVRRHRVLLEIAPSVISHSLSLLDVGCGTGDLVRWVGAKYEGWDVVPELVEAAKIKWEREKEFIVRDVMAYDGDEQWDYVVASGLFQFRDDEYLARAVSRMWSLCRIGVAFNFLTKADGTPGETAHAPEAIAHACRLTITPKLVLRTDYLPNEATVYLYR